MGNKDNHIAALDAYVEQTLAWSKDYLHYTTTYGLKAPTQTHGSTHGSTQGSNQFLPWLNNLDKDLQATSFQEFKYGDKEEFFVSRAFDPSDAMQAAGREKNVVFHIVGANGTVSKPTIVFPSYPAVDAVFVTPKVNSGTWQRPPPPWVHDFARDFHSDGWRVSLLGWSRGAYWSSHYVKTEPHIFTAAILMGGYPMGSPESFPSQANQLMTTGVPVMVVHALRDEFCQKELYEPWLQQLEKTAENIVGEYMSDNLCNPLFWQVNCYHKEVLGPCTVPGQGHKKHEIETRDMVWNFLVSAFSLKASREALQKTIRKI